MADRINVAELRRASMEADWFWGTETVIALLDVVEAARGVMPWLDSVELETALARFDFGETP